VRRRKIKNAEMALLGHLKELRKVLLFSAFAIAFGTIIGWVFSDQGYRILAEPLLNNSTVEFITTTPMEPVLVKIKISLAIGIIVAVPILFWQIWSFILPALKKKERKYLYYIVPSSVILFLGGAAFTYFFVLPVGLKVLLTIGGGAVQSTPFVTKSSYLNFILTFLLSFGLVFQLPVVLVLLMRLGVVSARTLARYRKYALLIIVVLAVIISPTPDLMTQLLMAGPMYLLYELSIWLGYIAGRKREKELKKLLQEGGVT